MPLQDQWQRKKQTKEQKKAARKEKLNPENQKSAKDVMDENERKRKREMEQEADHDSIDLDHSLLEQPREGMKPPKKLKVANASEAPHDLQASHNQADKGFGGIQKKTKAEKRKEKRKLKAEKATRKQEKAEAKTARKQEEQLAEATNTITSQVEQDEIEADPADMRDADMEAVNLDGIMEDAGHDSRSSVTPTPVPETPQSPAPHSASSSTSSIIPPSTADLSERPLPTQQSTTKNSVSSITVPASPSQPDKTSDLSRDDSTTNTFKPKKLPPGSEINTELLRARLKTRIDALRAARKAEGSEGQPARNRQELLEQRRRKEEERRQRKKEMRRKQKEAEAENAAAAQEAQLKSKKNIGGGPKGNGDAKETEHNLSYGNIHFSDGQSLDPNLSTLLPNPKQKGPQDPKTALTAAQNKHSRIAALDPTKRADIEDKDRWLNARKRIHGERVRDDANLLQKTVKRKEKAKGKSAKEWNAREEGVRHGQAMRQRKREENLKKRKEAKGGKGGKKNKGVKTKKGGKRPGFEGRFRT